MYWYPNYSGGELELPSGTLIIVEMVRGNNYFPNYSGGELELPT